LSGDHNHQFFQRGKLLEITEKTHPQTLSAAIGSAARLLRGVVNAEEEVPNNLISVWQTYVPGSHGRGFLQNIAECLSELECLKQSMEVAAAKPFLDANIRYEQQMEVLKLNCGCKICEPECLEDNIEMFCHVILVVTILPLGHCGIRNGCGGRSFSKTSRSRSHVQASDLKAGNIWQGRCFPTWLFGRRTWAVCVYLSRSPYPRRNIPVGKLYPIVHRSRN
jgi:hypothetical protein